MNHKLISPILAVGTILVGASSAFGEPSTTSNQNVFCQVNNGVPTTMAKTNEGKKLAIFHWRNDALPESANAQQLCNDVSAKLNNYPTQGEQLSFFGAAIDNLPAICAGNQQAAEQGNCNSVLFTLATADNSEIAKKVSDNVLAGILDDSLRQGKQMPTSSTRGVQSPFYPVNFWTLMGFKFIK
jgi:hypothetical protein